MSLPSFHLTFARSLFIDLFAEASEARSGIFPLVLIYIEHLCGPAHKDIYKTQTCSLFSLKKNTVPYKPKVIATSNMKTIEIFILAAFAFQTSYAQPESWIPTPTTYRSGVEICGKNEALTKELWKRVEVPINYSLPESNKTSIYYWLTKPFDSSLPTAIFINGGPGETSHGTHFDLPGWNVVFFDQRGNTCSRPQNLTDYLDLQFYSSENTARDIEAIRKDLGSSRISLYGVSYGTVPAQIYAHLFPMSTQAIVLEGIVYRGGELLISPARKRTLLQSYFDNLPDQKKKMILKLSDDSPIWFSAVAGNSLYQDDPLFTLTHLLNYILELPYEDGLHFVSSFVPQAPTTSPFGFDHVVLGMIGCKELGMNMPRLSSHLVFINEVLSPSQKNHFYEQYCTPLGFDPTKSKLYESVIYPSKAPVTYIQGLLDGATTADAAFLHYRSAISKHKNLIVVGKGGHLPVFALLGSGYSKGTEAVLQRQSLLLHALSGTIVPKKVLEDLTISTQLKWRHVHN